MKKKEPQANQLDEQLIMKAAAAALSDLQLDIEAREVVADGDDWCVRFSSEYNQFCDTFRDQYDKENSFELIREKIKRHILKQQQNKIRAGVRIRRGKTERRTQPPTLFETAVKAIGEVAGQTADITGEIINQASRLPETASKVFDETAKAISATIGPTSQSGESVEQPLARVRIKVAAPKSKRKRSTSSARKSSAKKATTSRKAASKKKRTTKKSTVKSTSRIGKKRGGTKKSAKGK
ncbi:MAG: hypothetical protein ICV68_09310 [Pyrinomonadaceae bacterium]|nr:hypothetical protein [Pyrinomonadaceae bacterium]